MTFSSPGSSHRWKRYPKYKDSGVEWLGEVPEGWELTPLKNLFLQKKEINHPDKTLLSVFRDQGVIPYKFSEENRNRPSLDLSTYQLVKKGNLVINKMKCWQGSLSISDYEGIVSPAYIVCCSIKKFEKRFIHHLLRSPQYIEQYQRFSYGVRCNQWDIRFDDFRLIPSLLPPSNEQKIILDFLDRETARIDVLIAKKERQIELLNEKRAALISHAVTKGLDPNVKMKNSGIEWIGEVPENWKIYPLIWHLSIHSGNSISTDLIESEKTQTHFFPVIGGNGLMGYTITHNINEQIIVIGRVGALCGNIHYIDYPAWVTDNALILNKIKEFHLKYLTYALYTLDINKLSSQNAQPLITGTIIKHQKIPCPHYYEQSNIVIYLDHKTTFIDTLIEKVRHSIDLLKEYRSALISAAVTGKIDVRGEVQA